MRRRGIPRRAVPHRDLVTVEPLTGNGAAGRSYGPRFTIGRAQIVDGLALQGTQYEKESNVSGVVYCDRAELGADLPFPDSRVTIWAGTPEQRFANVKRCERYEHPEIADLVVMVLR